MQMAAVSLKPSSKGVTVLIIVAAIILFGCVLSYVAAAGKLRGATEEMLKKEAAVNASKEMVQKLEKSKLDYVPTLLKQLEHLGRSVNLKVIGVRPEPNVPVALQKKASGDAQAAPGGANDAGAPKKPAPYDEMKINVEAEGKYINALDFLYRLTTFPKIIAVNTVEMTP